VYKSKKVKECKRVVEISLTGKLEKLPIAKKLTRYKADSDREKIIPSISGL